MFPKKYGQSKTPHCPFCQLPAHNKNPQGIPVCLKHKEEELGNLQCLCGEYLDLKDGKYGPFFLCIRCGPQNFNKVLECQKDIKAQPKQEGNSLDKKVQKERPAEITYGSDEID